MEGKAVFYQQCVGHLAMPILIDTKDVDEFVETVVRIAPAFGAIHLEDISAPECFEIEARLIERAAPARHARRRPRHRGRHAGRRDRRLPARSGRDSRVDGRPDRPRRRRLRHRVADEGRRRAAGDRVRPEPGVPRAGAAKGIEIADMDDRDAPRPTSSSRPRAGPGLITPEMVRPGQVDPRADQPGPGDPARRRARRRRRVRRRRLGGQQRPRLPGHLPRRAARRRRPGSTSR